MGGGGRSSNSTAWKTKPISSFFVGKEKQTTEIDQVVKERDKESDDANKENKMGISSQMRVSAIKKSKKNGTDRNRAKKKKQK